MHSLKKTSFFLALIFTIGAFFGLSCVSYANEEPENSVNLTVGENIVSHFYLDAAAYENQGGTKFFYSYNNGDTREKAEIVSETESFEEAKNSEGKVRIDVAQAAAQIAEPITVEILNNSNEKIDTVTYTAKDYCDSVINMNNSALLSYTSHPDELKKLCKSIVAYSKSSQGVFSDYMLKEGSVAVTDDYSFDLELDSANHISEYSKTDGNIKFKSVSFMCESVAKLRFYFAPADENDSTNYGAPVVSAPFSNSWTKGVDPDGTYKLYVQIDNIAPTDFDEPVIIEYAGASISMSVLDYAGIVISNSSTTSQHKTLAKSLIRYNEAADAFFSAPATVYVPAKEPTCKETGWIAHYELGGKSYSDADAQNEIDPTIEKIAHSYGSWEVTTSANLTASGVETKICSNCGESQTRNVQPFTFKLENTDDYLYRVGNSNTVSLGTFFDNASGTNFTGVTVSTANVAGTASCTYTANSTDWRSSTLKFNNTGVMTVTLKHGTETVKSFKLEVVAGTNVTGGTLGNRNANTVLLGDVNAAKSTTINNGATLFGNGFTITDARTDTSGGAGGYLLVNGGATIDNAVMMGKVYSSVVDSGQSNQEYAPGVYINGNANIYNSYIREAKYAVEIEGTGVVNIENTTVEGGTLASIAILGSSDVTLKNCTTITSQNGKKGLAVLVMSNSARLHLVGKLDQYNMLAKSGTNLPSTYKTVIDSLYDDSSSSNYKYNSKMNMGIFFITATQPGITSAESAAVLDLDDFDYKDNYGYIEKSSMGITGTIYTAKTAQAANLDTTPSAYSPTKNGQHPVVPTTSFNYTLAANYDAKDGTDDKEYCYGETKGSENRVYISFYEGGSKVFNPAILSVSKSGFSITPSSIMMGGVDYKNKTYTFTEAGNYEFVYSYTDSNNYDKNGSNYSVTYTKKLKVNVVTSEASAVEYHPEFTYPNIGDKSSKSVIANNQTYIMPNVDSTSSTIGSKVVDGKTVYYPIVTLTARNSSNSSAYSSGDIWYHAPAFKDINITDKNVNTGETLYTYNTSSTTWPHGISASTKPSTTGEYYGYVDTMPWTSHSGDTGRTSGRITNGSLGLCFKSGGFNSDRNASTQTVTFYYKGNDGIKYYYIIQYVYPAVTHTAGSCLAEGSMITMADGTQKAVEDIKPGDMLLSWSFFEGKYEAQPATLCIHHGTMETEVVKLKFSDGTVARIIGSHGFFNAERNTYSYLNSDNVADYIGESFVKVNGKANETVTLDSYETVIENVGIYSVETAYNINCVAEGMLSITDELCEGRFEFFEVGDNMKYDEAKMQADIEKYGLFEYEELADYLTPEQFELMNGKYYKVLIGRGTLTMDKLVELIEEYL